MQTPFSHLSSTLLHTRGHVGRDGQLGLVAATEVERVEVARLHDRPRGGAGGRDGVGEPSPGDEEALVGVDVGAVGEAQAIGPRQGDLVVHGLSVGEHLLAPGHVTGVDVALTDELAHVDGTEGPLGGPDIVDRDGAVAVGQVGVTDTGQDGALVVAGVLLGDGPHVVGLAVAPVGVELGA
eukprot:98311_1